MPVPVLGTQLQLLRDVSRPARLADLFALATGQRAVHPVRGVDHGLVRGQVVGHGGGHTVRSWLHVIAVPITTAITLFIIKRE